MEGERERESQYTLVVWSPVACMLDVAVIPFGLRNAALEAQAREAPLIGTI